MYKNLHLVRGVVVHLAHLYLAIVYGLQYAVDYYRGSLSVRNFGDGECLSVLQLRNFRPYAHTTCAVTVLIARYINAAACLEVGIQFERLVVEVGNCSVAYLIEVVRQYA